MSDIVSTDLAEAVADLDPAETLFIVSPKTYDARDDGGMALLAATPSLASLQIRVPARTHHSYPEAEELQPQRDPP